MMSVGIEERSHVWRVAKEAAFRRRAFWQNGKKKVNGISEPWANNAIRKKNRAVITILITLAAMLNWELDCFNAKRAFLHGKLKEDLQYT